MEHRFFVWDAASFVVVRYLCLGGGLEDEWFKEDREFRIYAINDDVLHYAQCKRFVEFYCSMVLSF